MIQLKVYSPSGIVVTGLVNPNPVVISNEINGLTDSTVDVEVMPNDYFAFNSTISLDQKSLTLDVSERLASLESFGSVIRDKATYPSGSNEVQKGYFVPAMDAKNIQAINKYWFDVTPKPKEEPKVETTK